MKDDGFDREQVRGGSAENDGHGILYVKGMTEVLRKQVQLCSKDDIMFRLERRDPLLRASLPSMTMEYTRIY